MKKNLLSKIIMAAFCVSLFGCGGNQKKNETPISTNPIKEKLEKFVTVKLTTDLSAFSDNQRKMIALMFDAADIMDDLFWEEAIGNKEAFLQSISDEYVKQYAMINYGPWDRLDNNNSFIEGYGVKPAGANFYPKDMTKEEFDAFEDDTKSSLYTLIRRDENGALVSIPFHVAFKAEVEKASALLKQAAELAEDAGLKNYLNLRAEALLTDEYLESDLAWMDMKTAPVDFIIGPIENYEDHLLGAKAAHESFILIKDSEWSDKLSRFSSLLPELQKDLPVDEKYKKEMPGSDSDINVYDALYYAGDCNAGSKTIAINLPNDERVQLQKGTRKLQLKNSMKAKFNNILMPIANELIVPEQRKHIKFYAFFTTVMFHEIAHGMGIKNTINGKGTVREALGETYSAIEEAKADILGLYLVNDLFDKGEITEGEIMDYYVTFFAGIFRSSRFGAASSHGKANMARFNHFNENGAFTRSEDGLYTINFEAMRKASIDLIQKIFVVQGEGDKETALAWIKEDGVIKEALRIDLDRLAKSNIPVDVVFEKGKTVAGL